MKDPRFEQLAKNLLDYSVELNSGEKILIEITENDATPLAKELVKYAYEKGGVPFLTIGSSQLQKVLLEGCSQEQIKLIAESEMVKMKNMQAYIGIRASGNINELSGIDSSKMKIYTTFFQKPVHSEQRVNHTKWCILRYPNSSMAQLASMPTDEFEDFYFKVCNLDYSRMSSAMDGLVELMNKTDRVRIIGINTDLTFSIKGLHAVKCDGKMNIPDGEVYTAPVKDSVNGIISYNAPTIYQGTNFENVVLEFKDGKIIKAESNNSDKLNQILDIDEGARFVGEFAIGVNPYIEKPMKDILFDEKIKGSFHFTPGSCYDECSNGNKSAIHWDMVQIQTLEYGGGEIWFDDVLVRKDGLFVINELKALNPENLK